MTAGRTHFCLLAAEELQLAWQLPTCALLLVLGFTLRLLVALLCGPSPSLLCSEMVLFMMTKNTSHPAFKGISALAKEARPEQLPPA